MEVMVGKLRASSMVCALVLASALLAGCNRTTPKSTTDSVATAASSPNTSSQPMSSTPSPASKSADVTWNAPTVNTDGSALTDLAGYYIYYGTSPTSLNQSVNVTNASAADYVVQGLTSGTWYFAVAAYTNEGTQSSLSAVVSKTIT